MLIGEVARRSGVSARMLRHYESLGLVVPSNRTPSGYREYSDADIGRIFHIEGLRKLGMSLTEVGDVLDDPDFDPQRLLTDLIARTRERIESEQRLLDHLEGVARLGQPGSDSLLLTIDLMRSLESADVIQRHKAALSSGIDGAVPVEAMAEAVLHETVLNAAGAMRWALAQTGAEAVPHLAEGLESESVQVRRNALTALAEISRTASPEELGTRAQALIGQSLRAGLDDADLEVRSIAALALGAIGDAAAVPALLTMAVDGPKDIEAAEALAVFAAGPGESGAVAAAGEGAESRLGGRAADGRLAGGAAADRPAGPDTAEQIVAELRRHAGSGAAVTRFRVLQVLLEIPGPHVDDFIAELGDDPSPELAATARAGLERRRRRRT